MCSHAGTSPVARARLRADVRSRTPGPARQEGHTRLPATVYIFRNRCMSCAGAPACDSQGWPRYVMEARVAMPRWPTTTGGRTEPGLRKRPSAGRAAGLVFCMSASVGRGRHPEQECMASGARPRGERLRITGCAGWGASGTRRWPTPRGGAGKEMQPWSRKCVCRFDVMLTKGPVHAGSRG